MEPTNTETAVPPVEAGKPKRNLKLIAIAAVAIAVVAVSALALAMLSSPPAGENGWMFKGAYANYEGSTSLMGYSFDFTVKLQVLDFNDTHIQMSTYFKMGSSVGESVENETSAWVPKESMNFVNAFSQESNMTKSYEATLGNRACIVYEYATDGPSVVVYVDKQTGWPLKMSMSMNEGFPMSLDINLKDTNIPGLK